MTKTIDFNTYQFRCSDLGKLMTAPRAKNEVLSQTTKEKLIEIFITETFGRNKELLNKYVTKGLMVEEDAITLFSRVQKKFYVKNEYRLYNEYITGEPDLFEGKDIQKATRIIDIKAAWDIFTFFKAKSETNKNYYYQLMGYMGLTNAPESILAYCLVNTPASLLDIEKKRTWYDMGCPGGNDLTYVEACKHIDHMGNFDDIPMKDRVHKTEIFSDAKTLEAIYAQVLLCRKWLVDYQAGLSEDALTKLLTEAVAKERK